MNSFVLYLLMGAPQGGGEGAAGGNWMSFLMFPAIIAIFYFLVIRPQNKKQKETQKMLAALKKGDRIVTIGGIHGTIQSVKEQSVIVKVDDSVKIEFSRSAISSVEAAAKEDKEEEAKEIEAPEAESGKK
jgi:preprotein translocase subunit YajC